jgi:DNA-binding response OmpR family regulator
MMLTAKGQELDRATGAEVGADLYMTKPFDPDDVLARAARVLGIELDG